MRAEDQWPGRDHDDAPDSGQAGLRGRAPRLEQRWSGDDRGTALTARPEPAQQDWQEIPTADGGVIIRFGGPELATLSNDDEGYNEEFYDNLATSLDDSDLATIAEELLEGIEADIQSRNVWMANYERGMGILGIELKQPKAEATGEGVSVVDHPLLVEACILYQSNASAELLPAAGPVKIDNGGQETAITDEDAQQLEKDFNIYVTVKRPEYYPDTEQMLFQQGFSGMGFKKIFHCPLRRAPVSDTVAPGDMIVSNTSTSLENCGRKTHRIKMRPAVMKRMQFVGAYRDIDLVTPTDDTTLIERKTANIAGVKSTTDLTRDTDHTVYETCAELDLPGDRHVDRGRPTGLPRPYIVTMDKDSRQILEIRRNWVEGDELFTERRRYVAYRYVPMFGFYASGLLNILGNTNSALTAGWRIMLDKGMFSNFPGGMYLKNGSRQLDNNFRAAPGEFVPVDGNGTDDIRKVIAPYPYTEPGTASQQFFKEVADTGARVGGSASIPVAEGKADTPVGTMLAAIEQVSKMISAVHRRCHTAQALEFQIWLELIREKPEDFVKYFEKDGFWTVERLQRALDNHSLIPRADPNTPTQMHRLLKMMALKQLQQLSPDLYDLKKVDEMILRVLGFDDPQELFAPPAPPGQMPPDPSLAIATIVAQTETQKAQLKHQTDSQANQIKAAQLELQKMADEGKLGTEQQKIQTTLQIAGMKEEGAMNREVLKIGAGLETKGLEHQHQAEQSDADREHQSSEGEAGRQSAVQLAKMKPKPAPGGKAKK